MIRTNVLEVNAAHHCTNRCASCNHASAFAKPYTMPVEVLERDLSVLATVLHTNFFCIQGGEPLLNPSIAEMIDVACDSGIADAYGILTNGRLFSKMPEEFWLKCARRNIELRCSVYQNLEAEELALAHSKAKDYGINFKPSPVTAFQKVLGHYPAGESFYNCRWSHCHTVHDGFFYICPISTFWPEQFMGLPKTIDGYPLDSISEDDLLRFIKRTVPLESCKRCTGQMAPGIPWHESPNEEEWMKESTV